MIFYSKNQQPFISFELGSLVKSIRASNRATIWLNTLYREDMYTFSFIAAAGSVNKISDYEYEVYGLPDGAYQYKLMVRSIDGITSFESNILTLNVT